MSDTNQVQVPVEPSAPVVETPMQPATSTPSSIDVSLCIIELNKIDSTVTLDEPTKQTMLKQLEPLNKVLQEKMTFLAPKKGYFGLFGGKKSKKSRKSKSKTKKTRR